MPHSHNINYYIGRMDDESLADALADFEDPLEGRSADLLSSLDLEDDFSDGGVEFDFDDPLDLNRTTPHPVWPEARQ